MRLIALIVSLIAVVSCGPSGEQRRDSSPLGNAQTPRFIRIESPTSGHTVSRGELIDLRIGLVADSIAPDSIVLYVNDRRIAALDGLSAHMPTDTLGVGIASVRATAWLDGQRQSASVNVQIKSDVVPKRLKYTIVHAYPHDPGAYTQGLFVHGGQLYESTGQNGASSLRRIEIETGRVMQSVNLEASHFGEGAALLGGLIYQLTWTSGLCFVYSAETFDRTASYTYSTQGWGLTSNGSELIMSDGSNVLRFMRPDGFAELRRVEVYDDHGPVRHLNELEYIDGLVYANVYLTDRIVLIDPQTGIVVAHADLSGILPASQRTGREDVLNGIAHDAERGRLFVTGKYWPKLFEIRLD